VPYTVDGKETLLKEKTRLKAALQNPLRKLKLSDEL
jgi:hypothetical protein